MRKNTLTLPLFLIILFLLVACLLTACEYKNDDETHIKYNKSSLMIGESITPTLWNVTDCKIRTNEKLRMLDDGTIVAKESGLGIVTVAFGSEIIQTVELEIFANELEFDKYYPDYITIYVGEEFKIKPQIKTFCNYKSSNNEFVNKSEVNNNIEYNVKYDDKIVVYDYNDNMIKAIGEGKAEIVFECDGLEKKLTLYVLDENKIYDFNLLNSFYFSYNIEKGNNVFINRIMMIGKGTFEYVVPSGLEYQNIYGCPRYETEDGELYLYGRFEDDEYAFFKIIECETSEDGKILNSDYEYAYPYNISKTKFVILDEVYSLSGEGKLNKNDDLTQKMVQFLYDYTHPTEVLYH